MQVAFVITALCGLVGALVGVGIMGTADHFTLDRTLWPVPICRTCGKRLGLASWIPVVGPYLTLRTCSACSERQPWVVAALVQIVTTILAILLYQQYGFSTYLVSASVESAVLVAVAVIDFQHRLIPTLLVYPTIVFAVLYSYVWPNLGIPSSLFGGLLAYSLFFGLAFIARLVFGEGALGDGDVSLAGLIGVICGYPMVVLSLAVGALCGGIGATLLLLFRRSPLGATIPYGPYLVMGVLFVLLKGNTTHPLYV